MRSLLLLLMLAAPAHADWLGDIWRTNDGLPAIVLNNDGVSVTMPQHAMNQARAAGLSVEQMVGAFLGRYGSRMCSEMADMNAARQLTVHLRVMNEVPPPFPGRAFVVDPDDIDVVIDYRPEQRTVCVDPDPTS
jgi:hypothetical protein